MALRVHAYYFSPTGTTEKVVRKIAYGLSEQLNTVAPIFVNFTEFEERQALTAIDIKDSVLVVGVPVYAGRVPNILLRYLNRFSGENTRLVLVVLYGNRAYDDALMELKEIFSEGGFSVVGAAAFIGAHAFSNVLAAGRPDADDFQMVHEFANAMALKIKNTEVNGASKVSCVIPGALPLRPYYTPLDHDGKTFDFKGIKPVTLDHCIHCGVCAQKCPAHSIDRVDHVTLHGKCIKCCACIKNCPVNAKVFDDSNFIKHKLELELECMERKEPELFI